VAVLPGDPTRTAPQAVTTALQPLVSQPVALSPGSLLSLTGLADEATIQTIAAQKAQAEQFLAQASMFEEQQMLAKALAMRPPEGEPLMAPLDVVPFVGAQGSRQSPARGRAGSDSGSGAGRPFRGRGRGVGRGRADRVFEDDEWSRSHGAGGDPAADFAADGGTEL